MDQNRPTETSQEQSAAEQPLERPRAKYEAPRLLRKHSVQRVTLLSGNQCVFDPPGSC